MIAALVEAALRSFALGGVVWIGLILFRVRNPHVHMTAWVVVLLASLAMPFVMHWPTLTIDRMPLSVPVPDDAWPADFAMPERPQSSLPMAPAARRVEGSLNPRWRVGLISGAADEHGRRLAADTRPGGSPSADRDGGPDQNVPRAEPIAPTMREGGRQGETDGGHGRQVRDEARMIDVEHEHVDEPQTLGQRVGAPRQEQVLEEAKPV